jgi:hypothetical protein
MRSTRVVTKDGEKIVLGRINEHDVDAMIPFPAIGEQIAERAGCPVTDSGMVRRSVRRRLMGIRSTPAENVPLTEPEIATCNASHRRFMQGLIAATVLLLIGGIAIDAMTASPTSYASGYFAPVSPQLPAKK